MQHANNYTCRPIAGKLLRLVLNFIMISNSKFIILCELYFIASIERFQDRFLNYLQFLQL